MTCERDLPYECAEGDYVTVTLRIGNTGRLPKFFLRAADKLPPALTLAGSDAPMILQLDPGEQRILSYNLNLTKRGAYPIGPTLVTTTDPFGFTTFKKMTGDVREMLVLPSPLPTRRLFLDGGVAGLRGDEGGTQRGGGMDFHGVREYRQGDDLRRVHWRTTARTGELAVTEYTQGSSLEVLVALDLSRAAYEETGADLQSALEYGVKLAVTVVDNLARYGHRALLLTPDTLNAGYPPSNKPQEMPALLEALARAEATSNSLARRSAGAVSPAGAGGNHAPDHHAARGRRAHAGDPPLRRAGRALVWILSRRTQLPSRRASAKGSGGRGRSHGRRRLAHRQSRRRSWGVGGGFGLWLPVIAPRVCSRRRRRRRAWRFTPPGYWRRSAVSNA